MIYDSLPEGNNVSGVRTPPPNDFCGGVMFIDRAVSSFGASPVLN